jgi:hypothetical protein
MKKKNAPPVHDLVHGQQHQVQVLQRALLVDRAPQQQGHALHQRGQHGGQEHLVLRRPRDQVEGQVAHGLEQDEARIHERDLGWGGGGVCVSA